jgi:hypothetical protein
MNIDTKFNRGDIVYSLGYDIKSCKWSVRCETVESVETIDRESGYIERYNCSYSYDVGPNDLYGSESEAKADCDRLNLAEKILKKRPLKIPTAPAKKFGSE